MTRTVSAILAIAAFMPASAQTVISVDMKNEIGRIPTLIYGAGAEDVNHEIYGGLYDQRLFGESFEEPTISNIENFISYDSPWSIEGSILKLNTSGHGKIICLYPEAENPSAEVDFRIDSPNAISGLIMNVTDPGNGADAFRGYEIGFNAGKRILVIGKHEHNWQPIAEIPVDFEPSQWNHLRVDFNGNKATILLNGNRIHEFEDTNNPLTKGRVGLRSFDGSASFRNLSIGGNAVAFNALPVGITNFRHYDYNWTTDGTNLSSATPGHAKIIYTGSEMEKGTAEVTLRHDGDRAITGLIFNVTEAGNGADNFRGYEVSLDATKKTLVVGKHDHDWKSIANLPVQFNTEDWKRLRVDFDGAKFTVTLNGEKLYEYEDTDNPLLSGKVGVRTFDGPATFKELSINGKRIETASMPTGVSSMWEPVGNGTYIHESTGSFNGTYHQTITGKPGDGIANFGLNKWGIGIEQNKKMSGYVYLKGSAPKAFAALQNCDGTKEYARYEISGIAPDEWKKFEFELIPSATDNDARFVVALDSEGTIGVDMTMLHTDSYPFRSDITEAFKKEGLNFLRYGGTMINAPEYMTKNMTGPQDLRPPYIGHWYRNSTNGFGIIEFVEFARMIGTEPTFAINIEDNPQDVLALLKELEPYDLKYIEIGNEENIGDESRPAYEHYVERFNVLYDAIHPVYPDLVFINAAWWRGDKPELMEYVFRSLDGKSALWDYHPWTDLVSEAKNVENDLKNIKRLFTTWNPNTDMRIAILEENGNTHCLHRALAHAVMLNVVRRRNGVVELDSPANALQPHRQNDNGWDQGQIFFNSSSTWCQPPYYAQQMAAANHQPILISSEFRNTNLNITATKSENGDKLVLHIVNSSPRAQKIRINAENAGKIKTINGLSLSGALNDANSPREPEKIIPKQFTLPEPTATLEPYSYTVIAMDCDEADGIADVTADNETSKATTYYNLSGQSVPSPSHGIYVTGSGEKISM